MRASPPRKWPPMREAVSRASIRVLSLHQLPSRGEERPSYKESKKGGHNYLHHVKELTGERAPPVIGTVRSHRLRTVTRVARCNAVHRLATHAAHCYPRTGCRRPRPWTARAPSRRSLASCPFNGVPRCVQPQVSSPSVSIELHTIGGFCCVSPDMPPPAEVQVHWPLKPPPRAPLSSPQPPHTASLH